MTKEKWKTYYEKHREELNARSRAWYQNNKERAAEQQRKYYKANKERFAEASKRWRENHPERYLNYRIQSAINFLKTNGYEVISNG